MTDQSQSAMGSSGDSALLRYFVPGLVVGMILGSMLGLFVGSRGGARVPDARDLPAAQSAPAPADRGDPATTPAEPAQQPEKTEPEGEKKPEDAAPGTN